MPIELIKIVPKITNRWSLAAFGVAAVIWMVSRALKSRGKQIPKIVYFCIVLLVLTPILAATWQEVSLEKNVMASVYRVRVTLMDSQQAPVENAKVWSSVGGEPKKVSGGWEFDIPVATKPADGKLIVFAAAPAAFLSGNRELVLENDYNPAVTIVLQRDTSASVRGIVTDTTGKAIKGAYVSVVGFNTEAVKTEDGGQFVLPAHAANGQQVYLHAEKAGYEPVNQYHPAGDDPATVVLSRAK